MTATVVVSLVGVVRLTLTLTLAMLDKTRPIPSRKLPRPLSLPRLPGIPLFDASGLSILPPLPRRDPSIHSGTPSRIRQILTARSVHGTGVVLLPQLLEKLHPLLRDHLHLATHRVPRVRMALVVRELRRHRDPPFAEVTALPELVRVLVANVK